MDHSGFRILLACLLAGVVTAGGAGEARAQDSAGDKQALVALYHATDGEYWANDENWLTDEPLGEWHGVTVSDGRVTGVFLSNNRLTGRIPPELGNLASLENLYLSDNRLTGPIPPQLGDLASLERLDLDDNQLTGSIPLELGNLASLERLDLADNQLTGPIPTELGNLSTLGVLNLDGNQLTGPIPPELGNLASLERLNLEDNQLTGPIPIELGNLVSLKILNLFDNQLAGPIPPELGDLSSLGQLNLFDNQLTGVIPAELGNLASLILLNLASNQLTGPIPPELGNFSNLGQLNLSGNRLTGPIPPETGTLLGLRSLNLANNQLTEGIPPELGDLSNLEELWLVSNSLRGPIPPELGALSSLTRLGLSQNDLAGPIPPELGNLSLLEELWLVGNSVTGSIPPELGNLSNLEWLNLADNRLTGAIPSELSNLASLERLDLTDNQLTGPIPSELGNLASLGGLDLADNQLTGPIPPELGNLASLGALDLSNNLLTGSIPSELGNRSSPYWLDFSNNLLTGSIPPELGDLSRLRKLSVANNQLTGPIPPELGNLDRLFLLNLASNQLAGPIPTELGNLSRLGRLILADNRLTGSIPPELGNLSFLQGDNPNSETDIFWFFWGGQLDLSSNRLTGPIPPELGKLFLLGVLNLGSNQLTGPIPLELGNLSRLWSLNLGSNQLTGRIPPELGNLSRLSELSLATNQLTGPIPESFTNLTLEHFYFHGNPGLSVLAHVAFREWLDGIGELRDQDYSPSTPFVPVILSAGGRNRSFFSSELTLTNRGTVPADLDLVYTAHIGGGSSVVNTWLYPGEQRIIPNAVDYLESGGGPFYIITIVISAIDPLESGGGRGAAILAAEDRIGTLRVEFGEFSSSDVAVTVRTTTPVPEGRAGLAYPAIPAEAGFGDEAVYVCGLRQDEQDRSNVALQNMGGWEEGAITLRTTVFSGDVDGKGPRVLEDVTLAPGGFHQYSGLLETAGFTQGYARVERVSGAAPFHAYGVINDQVNSDGSFVSAVRESSLAGVTGQTLPVIVETNVFTSELMVTNFSDAPKTVRFRFRAEAVETPDKTATVEWTFRPGQQVVVPNLVDMMRKMGTPGIGPSGQTFSGALFATVAEGDMSGIAIGARTSSPGGGGQYGVFYNAVPYGEAFGDSAWVYGLQQNEESRSNLALINTGEVDGSPSVFQLDIYDGKPSLDLSSYRLTGMLVNTVTGLRVPAGGWRQVNSILADYAPETAQGYVRITRISGNNPFLAYGVINDGGAPGQRSGDGAYLPARE